MQEVKVSIINGDILTTACSIAFLKHIEDQMSTPEEALDNKMSGRLASLLKEKEQEQYIAVDSTDIFPFSQLCVINFHKEDLPFTYSSVDSYARKIIHFARKDEYATSIATPIHGPGAALDASEAIETMLSAFARELQLRKGFGNLREIIFVERDKDIFKRVQERIKYMLNKNQIIISKGKYLFLQAERTTDSRQETIKHLDLKHLFVAMPYAKEFNNIYNYGIKGPVEQCKRKCERVDKELFTGDIIKRLKDRINSAELVIADITGNNPNVFYEVGYSAGIGKPIILISQKQDIPFDLLTERQITYDPYDIPLLADQLGKLLDVILAGG